MIIKKYEINLKKILLAIILIIILPLSFLFTWKAYIKSLDINGQFELSNIKINEIKNIISSDEEQNYQKKTLVNYLEAIFSKDILNSKLKVSYATLGIIVLFLMYFIYVKYKDDIKLKEYLPLCTTLLLGYIGYIILMLLLYVFSFGKVEGPMLSSYDRYMSTYILICIYTLIFIIVNHNKINKETKNKYIILLFIIAILIKPISYAKLRPDLILFDNHYFDIFKNSATLIDKYANDMDKVYIIDQTEKRLSILYKLFFK